jgi:hypothetical protein
MQNIVNDNYNPNITYFNQLPDPATNEPFNRATHPSDKPVISKHIFAIDSRQRNYDFYPHANNYNLPIPERYRNVTSIELKAAMLPRTEYNVNSSNKYLDFSIGDYISNIDIFTTLDSNTIKKNGVPLSPGIHKLTIDSPILTGSHIIGHDADIDVELDSNSKIIRYIYNNQGSGYSQSKPPRISLGDFKNFTVTVGTKYYAELREGQYVIGGNPQYTDFSTGDNKPSWTPTNLIAEIENSLSYSILQNATYCYKRKSWTSGTSDYDYPLLFTARLMSQYPTLQSYEPGASLSLPENSETNACNFNRIYTTNCLIFRTINEHNVYDQFTVNGIEYEVLKVDIINKNSVFDYIIYCKLLDPTKEWTGLGDSDEYKIAHWEFLFAQGENKIVNSASLIGYNKKNYYYNSLTKNHSFIHDAIEIDHVATTPSTLIPYGLTYSSENDYYLFGDPEYAVLSFRPKYGGNNISGINDRVDSQPNTNIDRVFACLIFDSTQPAVLQDVSSGKSIATIDSIGSSNNNNSSTFINYNNSPNLQEVKQLTGNSGSQNVSYNRAPGMLRAQKGHDFDRKVIDFPQPVAQIFDINIRFSKYSKLGKGDDNELYDFHGKEHFLLFEITCSDLMTGKRF